MHTDDLRVYLVLQFYLSYCWNPREKQDLKLESVSKRIYKSPMAMQGMLYILAMNSQTWLPI